MSTNEVIAYTLWAADILDVDTSVRVDTDTVAFPAWMNKSDVETALTEYVEETWIDCKLGRFAVLDTETVV